MSRAAPPRAHRVVLPPDLPFTAIHARFASAGWSGGPITLTPPMVEDEPELARYRLADEVATYTADPVVWLRVLTTTTPLPGRFLPTMTRQSLLEWLRAPGPDEQARERRLLAIMAAGELGLGAAVPRLRRIAQSEDALLADAARRSLRLLRNA